MNKSLTVNEAWKRLFVKYSIIDEINKNGYYEISANKIKDFKEPRLMAKFDSIESVPQVFKDNKINILPIKRGAYILGNFDLYKDFSGVREQSKIKTVDKSLVERFETINIKNISSESTSINVVLLTNILDEFLEEEKSFVTFNGRMGSGQFKFNINSLTSELPIRDITVNNAQCEIDCGLENKNSAVIIEAKNVWYPDFNIRQLYYPFRLWSNKINKPVRLVFIQYINEIFKLMEYKFEDINNYSSIELVKERRYSLQDATITKEDLWSVFKKSKGEITDEYCKDCVPFIQADNFERIISLMEILSKGNLSRSEIANIMEFEERQADYYFNAGRYLGLFGKLERYNRQIEIYLTDRGKEVMVLNYKARQLKLIELMLEHKIFYELFEQAFQSNKLPTLIEIQDKMIEYGVCTSESIVKRRSQSVLSWLSWIFNLIE